MNTPAPDPREIFVFDLEGHSVDERYDGMPAEKFVKLTGFQHRDGERVTVTDYWGLIEALGSLRRDVVISGHNIWQFDLPALGLSKTHQLQLARQRRVLDTWTIAGLLDAPPFYDPPGGGKRVSLIDGRGRPKIGMLKGFYKLDNLAHRYRFPGKTHDLTELAKRVGVDSEGRPLSGCCIYGSIPEDDPEYRDYQAGDVLASRHLVKALLGAFDAQGGLPEYYWREQRVAAVASVVSQNAFRLDIPLCQARKREGEEASQDFLGRLVDRYGLSLADAKGKPYKKPLTTTVGKEVLTRALGECGLSLADLMAVENGTTDKGNPSFGGKAFLALAEEHPNNVAFQELAEAVGIITGERAVYGTALKYLKPDGFSHPSIFTLQRSGRWSTTDPGLTVFGKRGKRVREREVYLPDVTWDEAGEDCHVLMTVDLSQVDARAVAVHSQDYAYMDLFAPGRDSHEEVAKAVFGFAAWQADPDGKRQEAKVFGHGYNYGLAERTMVEKHGADPELARQFYAMMLENFPRLEAWKNEVREQGSYVPYGQDYGILDNGYGRLMRVDPGRAYTQAPALMGQGTARDIMMEGILNLPDEIVGMIKAQVHDEIVLSVPMKHAKEIRDIVKRALTFEFLPKTVPNGRPIMIEADAGPFGMNWAACYEKKAKVAA